MLHVVVLEMSVRDEEYIYMHHSDLILDMMFKINVTIQINFV